MRLLPLALVLLAATEVPTRNTQTTATAAAWAPLGASATVDAGAGVFWNGLEVKGRQRSISEDTDFEQVGSVDAGNIYASVGVQAPNLPRAWANHSGYCAGGTCTILDGHGFSAITNPDAGVFMATLANAMTDTSAAIFAVPSGTIASHTAAFGGCQSYVLSTTKVGAFCYSTASALARPFEINWTIFNK